MFAGSNITIDGDTISATDTTYTFDGTYNASTNKAATQSTVTNAINALDGSITGTAGAGKTFTAFSQTNGKVTATFGDISITKSQVSDFPNLATVATTGQYNDLLNKPNLAAVATSGSYNDLSNRPTIGNGTLTLTKGTQTTTFTANQTGNSSMSIPSALSDLSQNASYRTVSDTEKATWNAKQGAVTVGQALDWDQGGTRLNVNGYNVFSEGNNIVIQGTSPYSPTINAIDEKVKQSPITSSTNNP